MTNAKRFYIAGKWQTPESNAQIEVANPADESVLATIAAASAQDVDRAVAAAKAAFGVYSRTTFEQRERWLVKLLEIYNRRYDEMARAISQEMGAPIDFAVAAQARTGQGHIEAGIKALREFRFQHDVSGGTVVREPIGVCALITPWNWPVNQIACKVVPALATGCTMVLKPSEVTPLSALLWAEMIDELDLPPGVFNMINGDGATAGAALVAHPDVDMISFTGSTRAGSAIGAVGAQMVKRVTQELGGKSPNIILEGADLRRAVERGVRHCMANSGQSCNAPTRMLVPERDYAQAVEIAREVAQSIRVEGPEQQGNHIGPVSSRVQFEKVRALIQVGIDEGATLVAGGLDAPAGLERGYYVKPTVFANVHNGMRIAREEIFGPVLSMIPYRNLDEAVAIANDTPYGLAAYVQGDGELARAVARDLRAGMVSLNGADQSFDAPFGGYKQSGNGREWGAFGFEDYLETKVINAG
ncbi:aldehyde dehydrogenase family protein [Paraburkholderia unamae]|uniref:Aldehyde dehydrogenase (NAD+) n=1 Tax=Paraburkholderia unamae TaxID=219649 RepID=A0ABX5KIS2_9BURK|nr:aldehyde dehydrogenase family protein [Paraburkholderia unamae]PVX81319.1 aldehyde dehydrogenase (NAD+) [Paraburkholderia unamae]